PPNDAVARGALGDLPRRLVVADRVEVVLEPAGAPRGVQPRERRALAEVRFDDADAQVQEPLELALVPSDRVRVREVERSIFRRDAASLVPHTVAAFQQLAPDLVLAREIGVLPQADVEAQMPEVPDHGARVLEACGGAFVVALLVGLETTGARARPGAPDPLAPQLRRAD